MFLVIFTHCEFLHLGFHHLWLWDHRFHLIKSESYGQNLEKLSSREHLLSFLGAEGLLQRCGWAQEFLDHLPSLLPYCPKAQYSSCKHWLSHTFRELPLITAPLLYSQFSATLGPVCGIEYVVELLNIFPSSSNVSNSVFYAEYSRSEAAGFFKICLSCNTRNANPSDSSF